MTFVGDHTRHLALLSRQPKATGIGGDGSGSQHHPMFSHLNDTMTWIKHNIAESLAEFLSQEGGIQDVIKTKSDIPRYVAELEIAEEEQEEDARVS